MKSKQIIHVAALTIACGIAMGASCSQNLQQTASTIGKGNLGDAFGGGGGGDKAANITKAVGAGADTWSISSDVERQRDIGESLAVSLTNSPGLVDDQKLTDYVIKVGLTVASACPRDDIDFTFGVLDSSEVNAYSAPHGFVFITRGAIEQMQDESELAGVLAHEVGHVVKNHGVTTLSKQGGIKFAAAAGAAAADANAQLADALGGAVDTLLGSPWNQGQETEADLEAVKYLKAAGYDPNGFVRFLSRLPANDGHVLKSHPRSGDRIAKVKQAIGTHAGGATLAARFKEATTK